MLWMILLLGVVVSMDGFAAALAYGVQRIRLSPAAVLVISLTSAGVICLAMTIGGAISRFLPETAARYIGAGILVALGCYLLYQHSRHEPEQEPESAAVPGETTVNEPIAQINLRMFGLVIQILRHPALADRDHSGVISWREAILLGLALALDAFGAGIGAAMTGMPALRTALAVGGVKVCALLGGWELGYRVQHKLSKKLVRLPGALLICLGLLDLLTR